MVESCAEICLSAFAPRPSLRTLPETTSQARHGADNGPADFRPSDQHLRHPDMQRIHTQHEHLTQSRKVSVPPNSYSRRYTGETKRFLIK